MKDKTFKAVVVKNVYRKKKKKKKRDLPGENSSPLTMLDVYSRLKSKVDCFEIITMKNASSRYSQKNVLARI
jgi:hypothetical protein